MKLLVDSTLCQAYGLCQDPAPELIGTDEWGYAQLLVKEVPPGMEDRAREAAAACPQAALRLVK